MAGKWTVVAKDVHFKKGEKFRTEQIIRAPFNEFNAGLVQNAMRLQSAVIGHAKIDKFVYGERDDLPMGTWAMVIYWTAQRDF